MNSRARVGLVTLTLSLAGLAIIWFAPGDAGPVTPGSQRRAAAGAGEPSTPSSARRLTGSAGTKGPLPRLIQRWQSMLHASGVFVSSECRALAAECVGQLGCGERLISLIRALRRYDSSVDHIFHDAVREFLEAGNGDAQWSSIAAITSDPYIRSLWSFHAAAGNSLWRHDELLALLPDEKDRAAARLGYLVAFGKSDPVSALRGLKDLGNFGEPLGFEGEAVKRTVAGTADLSAFSGMEPLLRAMRSASPDNWALRNAEDDLLERWIKGNGDSLIRHINDTPDFPRASTQHAICSLARTNPAKAATLLQGLSDTQQFDAAFVITLPCLMSCCRGEAELLASQVTAPALRKDAEGMLRDGLGGPP